jgi:RNA polymerase sigma factor (sigma-70 family)
VHLAAEIFSKYGDFIRGVIRSKTGDKSQVDDLFQNFFLSLVYKPPSGNISNIKGYLYKAIINDIIDNRRRIERYHNRMQGYAQYLQSTVIEDGTENILIETEEMNKMFKCIETQLPQCEAKAVILRYKKNYKIKEIAKALDINNIAAWRYISAGVRKIRRFLGNDQLQ